MPEHVDIIDPDIHEPKGIAAASANTVYISNGSGSGSWSKIPSNVLDGTSIFNNNKYQIAVVIPDVSTADFILVPIPFSSTLVRVTTALHGAITVADAELTLENSTGPATIGTITIPFTGSAEGDIETFNAVSNNTFTAGTYLKISTDGASTDTQKLTVFLEFTRTA